MGSVADDPVAIIEVGPAVVAAEESFSGRVGEDLVRRPHDPSPPFGPVDPDETPKARTPHGEAQGLQPMCRERLDLMDVQTVEQV